MTSCEDPLPPRPVPIHGAFAETTLIDYLAILWPDRSRRALREAFAQGRVRSGGRPAGARRRLRELSDLTVVGLPEALPSILTPARGAAVEAAHEASEEDRSLDSREESLPLDILHEDSRFVVIAKPGGIPVVPDRTREGTSVLALLIRRELAARSSKEPAEYRRYRVVHRIDRLTSGLVILACNGNAERRLAGDFEKRLVEKEYLAILHGVVAPARLSIDCPVVEGRKGRVRAELPTRSRRRRMLGEAQTCFEVLERYADSTLVVARPRTGRTHQIRVHAWACGHPLLVDPVYGRETKAGHRADLTQLSLHAWRYTLPPGWEAPRVFTCPPSAAFETLRSAAAHAGGG